MNEEKKQSNKLWLALGLGCGIPLGLIVLLFFGAIAYFATGPEGGVRLTNNMEDYALEYIEEHELLADGEKVRHPRQSRWLDKCDRPKGGCPTGSLRRCP